MVINLWWNLNLSRGLVSNMTAVIEVIIYKKADMQKVLKIWTCLLSNFKTILKSEKYPKCVLKKIYINLKY